MDNEKERKKERKKEKKNLELFFFPKKLLQKEFMSK
jgi:hypothetical protein